MTPFLRPRERELLALIANGATIEQAAWRLGISRTTARNHLYTARVRLGATCTTHLVALMLRRDATTYNSGWTA